jgi:glycosyltransferase involved in cell wall biosynthesis
MKIVHISKNDVGGGAARSAYRLHKGLQLAGHDSSMLVASRTSDDGSIIEFKRPAQFTALARRGLRQVRIARDFQRYEDSRPAGFELFSDDRTADGGALPAQMPSCDVVNLHWVPGLLDYPAFLGGVPRMKPVVWTFHDMNAFTGGCHYDLGCGRYVDHCGACPQLGSAKQRDLSFRIWERKKLAFSKLPPSRLRIVTPSRWLAQEAKRSPILGGFPVSVIPYGLDLDDFAQRDRTSVRNLLGIPLNANVVLFVAEGLNNRRKGFSVLIEALAQCAGVIPNLLLLSIGSNKPDVQLKTPWVHVGSVNNDRFLSMVYSAANVFVICSLQDNLPNTVLEALACGIPVIGPDVGGISDMVRNKVNGLRVDAPDAGLLASAIKGFLLSGAAEQQEMSANCRSIAVQEYSLQLQAQRYADLYKTLV